MRSRRPVGEKAAKEAAKKIKIIANESERGVKPPVTQGRALCRFKNSPGGRVSLIGGARKRLVQLGAPELLADGCEGFVGRADVAVV